jgi:hypothetical protein
MDNVQKIHCIKMNVNIYVEPHRNNKGIKVQILIVLPEKIRQRWSESFVDIKETWR